MTKHVKDRYRMKLPVATWAEDELRSNHAYGGKDTTVDGQLKTLDNLVASHCRLLQHLCDKGLVSGADLSRILNGYVGDVNLVDGE